MRRNRNSNAKKERIIMIASSAFVLTALTMTGIYMQTGDGKSQDDGYTLDFTALEENADNKSKELAQNLPIVEDSAKAPGESVNMEDDLDYMPREVGSGNIEIPGLTAQESELLPAGEFPIEEQLPAETEPSPEPIDGAEAAVEENTEPAGAEQISAGEPVLEQAMAVNGAELHFAAEDGLRRPLEGEVLIPYSMDGTIYFTTLDSYRYNPALMLVAQEGTSVYACAAGRVVDIFEDSEIGQAVTMELGDGYRLTYGQLKGLNVALNSYVEAGDMIASVAAPTKYFCAEGPNLYLKLMHDGRPVNPETLFQ